MKKIYLYADNEPFAMYDGDWTYDETVEIAEALGLNPTRNESGADLAPIEWASNDDSIQLKYMNVLYFKPELRAIVERTLRDLNYELKFGT